ncbi:MULTISPECIES: serine hydrolase domain-containing protein [unclassified Kitasatospora]|uniref:serine hydrolase domain-containing protein n=1 Tax=unclassified Kitasatospora TaxID=2633591 RepID=UPI0033FE74C8
MTVNDTGTTGADAGLAPPDSALAGFVEATATGSGIPGVAVAVWANGQETFACHGVTSVDDPLPVTPDTVFALGSVTKTFTATALMWLVEDGLVDLGSPVRRYVPQLRLADEQAAAQTTVSDLLNHTAGPDRGPVLDTAEGDDALAAEVARLTDLPLLAAPEERASCSQAGYNLLGRVIEKVSGMPYEQAVAEFVLDPLGLEDSLFAPGDVPRWRFAAGHTTDAEGTSAVSRRRNGTRANNPGGGLSSSPADLLRWARFHLGDGRTQRGEHLLPADSLRQMREPPGTVRSSALADAIGTCWVLRDIDQVRTVWQGGSAFGQFVELLLVPERDFAVVSASNAGPQGIPGSHAIVRFALEHYAGLVDRDPEDEHSRAPGVDLADRHVGRAPTS